MGFSIKDYKARRDAAAAIFQEEQVGFSYPHGAFYMMVDISCCGMDSEEFALKLLAEEHVGVAPGGTFGKSTSQMIRISCGTEMDNLCEGVRRALPLYQEIYKITSKGNLGSVSCKGRAVRNASCI